MFFQACIIRSVHLSVSGTLFCDPNFFFREILFNICFDFFNSSQQRKKAFLENLKIYSIFQLFEAETFWWKEFVDLGCTIIWAFCSCWIFDTYVWSLSKIIVNPSQIPLDAGPALCRSMINTSSRTRAFIYRPNNFPPHVELVINEHSARILSWLLS